MGFPRELLTEGEAVVREVRPHWKALVAPVFRTVVIWSVAGYLIAIVDDGWLRWTLAGVALALWWWLAGLRLLRWRFTLFVLTNERLITRSGVIAKRSKEIPLETINDVAFNQTVLDRMLGSGDLVIESAGEHGQEVFDDIPEPASMQKEIYTAAERRKGLDAPAAAGSVADEIAKLADLRDRGVLTADEFEARKRRLLSQ